MEWIEVAVATTGEGVEPVFGVLLSCGVTGAQIIDDVEMIRFLEDNPLTWDYLDESLREHPDENAYVIFYLTPGLEGNESLQLIKAHLASLRQMSLGFSVGSLSLRCKTVDDESWLHEWKKHYKPFRIGRSVVIKPFWEAYAAQPGDIVFTIDPGAVFGTGLHQTTQLCIEALERFYAPGGIMLDIGCGSGILSVIALLLGMDSAVACDFDPAAMLAAKENVLKNPVDPSRYTVITGDILNDDTLVETIKQQSYEVITANIVADVVISLSSFVGDFLKPGGVFIVSGIITARVEDVTTALTANGFQVIACFERDGWYCAAASRDAHA